MTKKKTNDEGMGSVDTIFSAQTFRDEEGKLARLRPTDVRLSTQTFRDARGDLEEPRLKLGGLICGHSSSCAEAESLLRNSAAEKGYSHVYNLRILSGDGNRAFAPDYTLTADGYRQIKGGE